MFFDDSRPDRQKRAARFRGNRAVQLAASPVPEPKPYVFLTHEDLTEASRTLVFDVEAYRNYFVVSFKCVETGRVVFFEAYGDHGLTPDQCQRLAFILYRHRLIGFNSTHYDIVILALALMGVPPFKLKEASDEIIVGGLQPYEMWRKYNLPNLNVNHIDLIEVAPIEASLKLYAARLHAERLQDLPYQPDAWLTPEQVAIVRDYNVNDLDVTHLLYDNLKPQLSLREAIGREYNIDVRSKSDAQISEAVIGSELRKLGLDPKPPKIAPGWQFQYRAPAFIQFKTPQLQHVLETVGRAVFTVAEHGGVDLPEEIKALAPRLGIGVYRMGIGGLHSSEKSVGYVADENTLIIDRDVASYYPAIILNCGLFPQHLGEAYLEVYRALVNRRLGAKLDAKKAEKAGDTQAALTFTVSADGLKITINGGFGKLGNKYSIFYAPDLLIQVTLTGQLSLLMLIEMIELAGIPVVSANTDGIVIKCPASRAADLETVVMQWENVTGFVTEETRYKSIWSRDVNNYVAVKEDGKCKVKGVYSERGSALNSVLSKNPEHLICSDAVQSYLAHGTPLTETIEGCQDIRRFVTVRRVRGGAEKAGVYLGKVVRWYYAKGEEGELLTVTHGSTVPNTRGAKPLMTLPAGLPADIDLDWYVDKAVEMLYDLGRYERPKVGRLF